MSIRVFPRKPSPAEVAGRAAAPDVTDRFAKLRGTTQYGTSSNSAYKAPKPIPNKPRASNKPRPKLKNKPKPRYNVSKNSNVTPGKVVAKMDSTAPYALAVDDSIRNQLYNQIGLAETYRDRTRRVNELEDFNIARQRQYEESRRGYGYTPAERRILAEKDQRRKQLHKFAENISSNSIIMGHTPQDQLWDADKVEEAQNQQNLINSSLLSSNYSNLANNVNIYSESGQLLMNDIFKDATAPYRAVDAALPALGGAGRGARLVGRTLNGVAKGRLAVGTAVSKAPVIKHIINAGKWGKDMFRAWAPDWLFNTVKTGQNVVGNIAGTAYNNLSLTGFTNRVLGLGWTPTLISAGNALIGTGKTFYDIGKNIYNGKTPSFKNATSLASAVGVPGASAVSLGLNVNDSLGNPNTENPNAENAYNIYNTGISTASLLAK